MSPSALSFLYLLLAAAELAWEGTLILLNLRYVAAHAAEVPPYFRKLWARRHSDPPEESYAKSVRYTLARSRLALTALPVTSIAAVALVVRLVAATPFPDYRPRFLVSCDKHCRTQSSHIGRARHRLFPRRTIRA